MRSFAVAEDVLSFVSYRIREEYFLKISCSNYYITPACTCDDTLNKKLSGRSNSQSVVVRCRLSIIVLRTQLNNDSKSPSGSWS
jgi:hypothetical protein